VVHDANVEVRDLDTGNVLATLPHAREQYPFAAWSPDGTLLATEGADWIIRLWDWAKAKEVVRMEGTKSAGIYFAFNRAGDLLTSGSWDGLLRIWDTRTGKQLLHSTTFSGRYQFSRDGQHLGIRVVGSKLQILEVAIHREYRTLRLAGNGDVRGRWFAAWTSDGLGLWDVPSGKFYGAVPMGYTVCARFDPNGDLLTYGPQGLLHWPVRQDPAVPNTLRIGPPRALLLHGSDASGSQSRDGKLIAVGNLGGGAYLVQADGLRRPIRLPHADVWNAAISPDGCWVATGCQHNTGVRIWETATGRLVRVLLPKLDGCGVIFSPDGRFLATTTSHDELVLWSTGSWQEQSRVPCSRGAAFAPDGTLVAAGDGQGVIGLFEPATGRELARFTDPDQDRCSWLVFSSDGTRLIGNALESQSMRVWDLRGIRKQLTELGLDWHAPDYPAPSTDSEPNIAPPLRVEPIHPEWAGDRELLAAQCRIALTGAVLANPFDAEAHCRLGCVLLDQGNVQLAYAHLTTAIATGHAPDSAFADRAEAAFRLARWDDAAADATRYLKLVPQADTLRRLRANANAKLGRHEEVIADTTALITSLPPELPPDQRLHRLRAQAYDALGKPDLARPDHALAQ
jgi:WD40 repeat protein